MSARPETSGVTNAPDTSNITKLCIFAGSGNLPRLLVDHCLTQQIKPFVIGFKGQTDPKKYEDCEYLETHIGKSGKTLAWIKQHDVGDAVFIGAIKRPLLRTMIPDWTTLKFFLTRGIWARGDNAILIAAKNFLLERGVALHGVHQFLPALLTPAGLLTEAASDQYRQDIVVGIQESQELGQQDKGQAVIVKEGKIIGREDQKGTNALIYRYGQKGAILVKTCKPQQDKDLDLPTIGLGTLEACLEQDMAGIAIQAGNSLMLDQEELIQKADAEEFFVEGITVSDV